MTGIQLVAIAFAAGMIFLTYNSFRRRDLRLPEFLLWMAVWVVLILVSAFPDRLRAVIRPLEIARLLDLVMIAGILLLSLLVFMLNRTVRRLEDRLSRLVRNLALQDLDSEPEPAQPKTSE